MSMGRLFWKFLLAFWLGSLAIAATITGGVSLMRSLDWLPESRAVERRLLFMVETAATLLQNGDTRAVQRLVEDWRQQGILPPLYVSDARGLSLSGQPLPAADVASARQVAATNAASARQVRGQDGSDYLVFVRAADVSLALSDGPPGRPPLYLPLAAILLVGLLFSALLAWYLARPLRHLRWAFRSAAEGRLETRVQPLMGARRDEIADLGQDFDAMAQRLQQLIGAQQRLLHDVSHELRSPLARLEAAIGLARQNPERSAEMLGRIERESERLNVLVGELLTLARLEAGAGEVARERVDLVELVAAIADDAQFEARSHGRDVALYAQGEFVADVGAELLYRAFENIIRNAVKYTAEGSVVEVTVAPGADALHVTVADRGPGVPDAQRDAIFQPFHRVPGSDGAGFGLGLAIARRAVESHGGHIAATARDGGGLVLSVTLPRPPGKERVINAV